MTSIRFILGDQLSHSISSLEGIDQQNDIILMCEVRDEATYVKHHQKKIAFIFSAMRHFAKELEEKGYRVTYYTLDDTKDTPSFTKTLEKAINQHQAEKVIITEPGEYRVLKAMQQWSSMFDVAVDIREDTRFLCSIDEFKTWASGLKQLRMENFYRLMRKKHAILIQSDGNPVGGKWNFDAENRKPPSKNLSIPDHYEQATDSITQAVLELVAQEFSDHFGDLEPFPFAINRKQARKALDLFIKERLEYFGDYQDAMVEGEPWMYHSHISFYINTGLLLPQECVDAAITAYKNEKAPMNAVEGFIRQIIGWREYVRGIYWLKMPHYKHKNFFEAKRKLPDFFWDGQTKMNCMRQVILETKENAYAHHIQRLMVVGNFSLIAGLDPDHVNEWYLLVYADAYEWVELPNVTGMILFADGGYLASKPYAAGGNYINKMSDYCKQCSYKISKKNGNEACPFNYLYWDFLVRNRKKLESNHRIGMMYRTFDRMTDDKKEAIQTDSQRFLRSL